MKVKPDGLLYTALLTLCSLGVSAQSSGDYLKAADRYFKEGDYYTASHYYEKYLSGASNKSVSGFNPYVVQRPGSKVGAANSAGRKDAVYNLAESYRKINDFAKAKPYYQEAAIQGLVFPLAAYWEAKCDRALGSIDSAEAGFKTFAISYKNVDEISKDVQKELDNLAFIKKQAERKDLTRFVIARSGGIINESGASYAPFYLGDGRLSFTSTRPDTNMVSGKNIYTNNIYVSSAGNSVPSVEKLNIPAGSKKEQGVAAFTPGGNTLFITRWETKKGGVSAIYSSVNTGGSWSEPVRVATVNVDGANARQPFVTADGRYLLFSSDRPGGQGGFDIWYAILDSSYQPAGEPVNIGSGINTAGDDEAPFYHQGSHTLVLASNGRTGMGGYDLYYSKGDFTRWETPVNMGQPVNSIKDDIYFASNDKTSIWGNAVFSSDRGSACCLELYAFNRRNLSKTISGRVVDCDGKTPVPGASVTIDDANGNNLASRITDASGKYSLTMDEYKELNISASDSGYNSNSLVVPAPTAESDSLIDAVICLTAVKKPIKENNPVVLEDILFGFGGYTLTAASASALDTIASLMKQFPAMEIELSSHTDDVGSMAANQKLSERRADACASYLLKKGISPGRIQAKGYGETVPVAPNKVEGKDNPEGRERNRRTEFKIIHY